MDDFSYSVIRSFNQYLNTNYATASGEQLVLNPYPGQVNIKGSDTVSVHFYDRRITEIGGGRQVSGSEARFGEFWCKVDCWSPPNSAGEPRNGANRKLVDKVEKVLKPKVRINLLQWDGTGGTTVAGGMYVRQTGAAWLPVEEMDGYTRWQLDYKIRAVDTD